MKVRAGAQGGRPHVLSNSDIHCNREGMTSCTSVVQQLSLLFPAMLCNCSLWLDNAVNVLAVLHMVIRKIESQNTGNWKRPLEIIKPCPGKAGSLYMVLLHDAAILIS